MKKLIYITFLSLFIGLSAHAQETPPTGLKAVNGQFYIHLPDSGIWQQKGAPYGWERLARFKDLTSTTGTVTSVGATGSNGVIVGGASPITGAGTFTFQIDSSLYTTRARLGNYQTKAQNIAAYQPIGSYALQATTVSAGYGLSGGGSLAANRNFIVDTAGSIVAKSYFNTVIGTATLSRISGLSAIYQPLENQRLSTSNTPAFLGLYSTGPITMTAQSSVTTPASTTQIMYANGTGAFTIMGSNGFAASISKGALTASHTFYLPDVTDTIVNAARLRAFQSYVAANYSPISGGSYALQSTTISAGTGLSGGGSLAANRTISADTTVLAPKAYVNNFETKVYGAANYVPLARTITINGTTFDLSANRSWTVAGVTGTTNYLARFTGTSAIGSSSQMYDDGAGIMLGTTVNSGFQFDQTGTFRSQGNFGIGKVGNPVPFSYTAFTTGGTLAAATYYYKIVAIDNTSVQTNPSSEINATVSSGTTGSVNIQWTAVTGATGYRVYRGTSTGAENVYISTTLTNFTDIGSAGTAGTPPTINASAVTWLTTDGAINGYRFGVGPGTNVSTNLIIGSGSAASANTSGSSLIALGPNALGHNTTGSKLVAIGNNALSNETINGSSIGIGDAAGGGITSGQYDIAIGPSSLGANTSFSIGIGSQALANSTGQNNNGIGINALYYNAAGANNTANGYQVGMFYGGSSSNHNTQIDNSVLEGYQAEPNGNNETNEIVIGYNAIGAGSNTSTIGNTSTINNYLYGAGVTMPTKAAINATATATATQLSTGVITSTSAALTTITLPTATAAASQLKVIAGSTFEFTVDNSAGANIVTLVLGSGMTQLSDITGANTLTIPSGAIGVFRLYFSSTSAAYFSRIE